MLDRYDRCHTVSDIGSGKVGVFFLQDSQFSRILVDDRCKYCLKSGNMRSAFCIVDIITKSEDIFMKFVCILERSFYFNAFTFSLEIDHIMNRLDIFIEIPDKTDDSLRFMILDMLDLLSSLILINDRQLRIEICSLMHTAFDIILFESGLFKDLRIRQKVDLCSGLSCLTDRWQQTVFKLQYRIPSLIPIMMDLTLTADLNIHIGRQRIDYRRSDSMQSTACLICLVVKFAPRMQCGKNKSGCRHPFFMHTYRNTATIIFYRTGTVCFQRHMDRIAKSCQMLVHGIVHDLIDQVV